jgi:tetratricopeptide (TPR) repeat protein
MREVITDPRGIYAFEQLPQGTYTVQVLAGQADVSKVLTLRHDVRMRANFGIDPHNEFRRMVRVASHRDLRRSHRAQREDDGTDDGIAIGNGTATPSRARPTAARPAVRAPMTPEPVRSEPAKPDAVPPPAEPERVPEPDEPELLGEGEDGDEPEPLDVPPPVVEETIVADEFRNLPVGHTTSRDFTAVVDTAATSSPDSAGISLAGTTGAEMVYAVHGASISAPSEPKPARVELGPTAFEGPDMRRRPVRRWLRQQLEPVERCYYRALADGRWTRGRLVVRLELREGRVIGVGRHEPKTAAERGLDDPELLRCLDQALRRWELPWQATSLTQTLVFHPNDGPPDWFWYETDLEQAPETPAVNHPFTEVENALAAGERGRALALATAWREHAPVDVLALVALGDAARARGDVRRAARAYGSIIDLHPSRAELLRFAAAQLEALDDPAALDVAIDAYRQAVAQRPDHPTGHHNLALALLRRGQPRAAFEVLELALQQPIPPDRFAAVHAVLHEDLTIAGAAWLRLEPTLAPAIHERLAVLNASPATTPSLRVVLTWESDVSDVDLHVIDARGDQAYSQDPVLDSGGVLLADVSNGFGPECVVIPDPPAGYPYSLRVHYYARGPMGYGLGKVSVLHHDGSGGVRVDDRPFVALEDGAWLELGPISPPGARALP